MTKVLVTGGSGNLGRYVIPRLVEEGHEVTAFDTQDPVALNEDGTKVPFVKGDLTSLADCMRALTFSGAPVVVHLGALPHPTELVEGRNVQRAPEDTTMRVNTMGTYYLLDAGRRLGLKQVIMASTFYVLGIGNRISNTGFSVDYLPIDEEHPLRPEDSYGFSKMFGEEMLKAYGRAYGIRSVAFRLMGVRYPHRDRFGDRMGTSPEPRAGFTLPFITTYQYVDARDVANACALAIKADGLEQFEAFYLSTDTAYREDTKEVVARVWPDLTEMAAGIKGTDGVISDGKARQKLGYVPQFSWRDTPVDGAR